MTPHAMTLPGLAVPTWQLRDKADPCRPRVRRPAPRPPAAKQRPGRPGAAAGHGHPVRAGRVAHPLAPPGPRVVCAPAAQDRLNLHWAAMHLSVSLVDYVIVHILH